MSSMAHQHEGPTKPTACLIFVRKAFLPRVCRFTRGLANLFSPSRELGLSLILAHAKNTSIFLAPSVLSSAWPPILELPTCQWHLGTSSHHQATCLLCSRTLWPLLLQLSAYKCSSFQLHVIVRSLAPASSRTQQTPAISLAARQPTFTQACTPARA